jgi:hypothetical protein
VRLTKGKMPSLNGISIPSLTLMDKEGFLLENTDIIIERLWRRRK